VRAGLGGHRLWLSGTVHSFRRAGVWPPRPADRNAFPPLLALTGCGVVFVLLPGAYVVGMLLAPGVFARPRAGANPPAMVTFVFTWWVALAAFITTWNRVRARLAAAARPGAVPRTDLRRPVRRRRALEGVRRQLRAVHRGDRVHPADRPAGLAAAGARRARPELRRRRADRLGRPNPARLPGHV